MSQDMYEFDPNRLGTRESRQQAKLHELSLLDSPPLAVCFVCGVVFHDRPDASAEPFWFTECEEHRKVSFVRGLTKRPGKGRR